MDFQNSKIYLSKNRDENIKTCFDVQVKFFYPQNVSELDNSIENFQRNKVDDNDNVMGEKSKYNRVIIMDEVSGLAHKSENFAGFLTVARKFNFTVVYVFHTMYPSNQNWQMIIAQTKIFNILPGSIQISSISKILTANFK